MFEAEATVRITLQVRHEETMAHQIAVHTPSNFFGNCDPVKDQSLYGSMFRIANWARHKLETVT
jgi:hypothetical protein